MTFIEMIEELQAGNEVLATTKTGTYRIRSVGELLNAKLPNTIETASYQIIKNPLRSKDALMYAVSKLSCVNAYGLEGAETFPNCGKCVVCLCKKEMGDFE